MSKINRIRIMNLNYNNNTIRIDDETFDLNGETTLLSLRNGGGKTVLVQMIISLFVNKSYRDFADRPFKSYFSTNKPTFIMTEWQLDNAQGYFLAGMMVRKNQHLEENSDEELDMVNFTGSYNKACGYDLDTLPVIELSENGKVLKGFGTCKKIFETLKEDSSNDFAYYDMASTHFRRQYFTKLKEYQIDNREWESIIKKVNLKESGLSELFANAKDEKGLIENWFIDAIQSKLNTNHNRIKDFQNLAYKLVNQYRDNESAIRRSKHIKLFFEDAKAIDQQVENYEAAQQQVNVQKSQVAAFLKAVSAYMEQLSDELTVSRDELTKLMYAMKSILHEKYSYEIYQMQERKADFVRQRIDSEVRITTNQRNIENTEKEICRYECAQIYADGVEHEKERRRLQEKIKLISETQQDNQQEIAAVGATLFHYYTEKYEMTVKAREDLEQLIGELRDDQAACAAQRENIYNETKNLMKKSGQTEQALQNYDSVESRFNTKYQTDLARNILGEYEEGTLEILRRSCEDKLIAAKAEITRLSNKVDALNGENNECMDKSLRLRGEQERCKSGAARLEQEYSVLKKERQMRRIYMKYVDAPETELDNKASLLARFDAKIKELELQKDELNDALKAAAKEYDNLRQGRTMELPQNIKDYFEEQNIQYIYGMEWLRRNTRTAQENQELVNHNPFIPYCIIMDADNAKRILNLREEVYTSFPIPIIMRENLEAAVETKGGYVQLDKIHFFVAFNRHLLNLEELKLILAEKEKIIAGFQEKLQQKDTELNTYREYRSAILMQEFTIEKIRQIEVEIENNNALLHELDKEYIENEQRKKEIAEEIKKYAAAVHEQNNVVRELNACGRDIEELVREYGQYLANRAEKERIEIKQKECEEKSEALKVQERDILKRLEHEEECRRNICGKESDYSDKAETYAAYQDEKPAAADTQADIVVLETRFESMTKKTEAALDELRERLTQENQRYNNKQQELSIKNRYCFEEKEYAGLQLTQAIMQSLRDTLDKSRREENAAREENDSLNSAIAVLTEKIDNAKTTMQEKTGEKELVEKKSIVDTEFEERCHIKKYEREQKEKQIAESERRKMMLETIRNAMAEYAEYTVTCEIEPIMLYNMDEADITAYQKNLRIALNRCSQKRSEEQKKTDSIIRNLAAKKEYQDDFFRKSFVNLTALTEDVYLLKEQLDTYYQTYDTMLKKLQTDLENIEKERATVEESFMEYVRSINDNIKMIDKNSTITVRDRNLKMLRITVPDWDSNKEYYQAKLNAYMDNFMKRCTEAIENNKNVEELLGKIITTKVLYDEIVGIANIEIKMYKIEAEREVLISWADVSANSGGEGFLSAFVILSCLLSYMRRDDADLFAAGEEGKVLIMDNPFAQTNAEHLLKPLMDIARKTNTQLICLSGLGGDSIYNRFDNIYVLKLNDSSLKQGRQYMTSEHIKGRDIRKMQLSQFVIEEQMSLF